MRKNRVAACILAMFLLTGCSAPAPVSSEAMPYSAPEQEVITRSLFDSPDRTISEEDIQRLLSGRIAVPDTVRLAVYKFAGGSMNRYYAYYASDEEYLKTQQSHIDTLVDRLQGAEKVKKVIVVPSMMTSRHPNITQLRESAVRLQADLMLVFSLNSDIYYKYKAFQKNEAKAFATCEAILLDTRTGVIPHSSIVTREFLVSKEGEDWSNEETRKRAENGAIMLTLIETGTTVATFLDNN